jgi:hypothetical protein
MSNSRVGTKPHARDKFVTRLRRVKIIILANMVCRCRNTQSAYEIQNDFEACHSPISKFEKVLELQFSKCEINPKPHNYRRN